ncbi:FAD-dependent monooxygenase [Streptomyces roseirectus]|uniref:FAD-dependent monooxygenase n=1 Tax=Streptomyces roseirectus TaxID=2768066 RepID=A0A7H0ICU6_9ACTN|nr:FAD-dependent monooxygenase [Streptomyces roseirectus]QNP70612.1 FAD-dependent monooxygenase [Streptomyces roseirectus]
MQHTDVLIVGAGPTGLTLGIDLARRGVDALMVERGPALSPGSRGKGLQPRTLEVFQDLGVLDPILAAGGPYPATLFWKDGVQLGEHQMFEPVEQATAGSRFTAPWMAPQWRTQRILHTRLRTLGGQVSFGHEVVTIHQDDDGVTASFADGTTLRARYAVAADGGRSALRRAAGIGMTGDGAPESDPFLVADVRVPGLSRTHWHVFQSEAGLLGLCPLAGTDEFQLFAQLPSDKPLSDAVSAETVTALLRERTHLTEAAGLGWHSVFRPRTALADRFRAGRVLLAGDAAHVHPPSGGQGLNTGVQDAYNLGWKLGADLKDPSLGVLDTYEEERRAIASDMLALATAVQRGEVRRGRSTHQLDLNYRESSLTRETRTAPAGLRAGDRVPHTLHGLDLHARIQGPGWSEPTLPEGVFLVRPDGYVGWAGDSREGLAEYAAGVGA